MMMPKEMGKQAENPQKIPILLTIIVPPATPRLERGSPAMGGEQLTACARKPPQTNYFPKRRG